MNMKPFRRILIGLTTASLACNGAWAQGANPTANSQNFVIPQVQSIGPTDLFQDVVSGYPTALGAYASSLMLGNFGATLIGNNPENVIPGGDATTNNWAHGTTGASVTTTLTYGGPNSFAYWSGASTAVTVSKDTTAANLATGYKADFLFQRTAAQTGVVQACMAHEVENVNSLAFQGQIAELDFNVATGANFSGTGVTAYITYGTLAAGDEGTAKLAYGINAGGGGGSGWTGQVNQSATYALAANSGPVRLTFAAPIPVTATEIGVAICWTPTGTAGTSDYLALSGIQLTKNSALAKVAATAATFLNPNDNRAKAFAFRPQSFETFLQQRYAYVLSEPAAGVIVPTGIGQSASTTVCLLSIPFPVPMRAAPTFTNALTASTFKIGATGLAPIILATPFAATATANTTIGASLNFTTAASQTANAACGPLVGNGGSGSMLFSAEL
jgi:hypothetical protein